MEYLDKLKLRQNLAMRPHWMNGLLLFCAFMTFIYLPWDLFVKPVVEDQEVWFGYTFTGWFAKATGFLHWLVYGAGSWGFWKMKSWLFPWASLYIAQIAIGMFVWSFLSDEGPGIAIGLITAIPFALLAVALWRAKSRFSSDAVKIQNEQMSETEADSGRE
jgi:hypothetical protein